MECKTQNERHRYLLVHCDRQVQIIVVAKMNCELLEYRHNLIGSDLKNLSRFCHNLLLKIRPPSTLISLPLVSASRADANS